MGNISRRHFFFGPMIDPAWSDLPCPPIPLVMPNFGNLDCRLIKGESHLKPFSWMEARILAEVPTRKEGGIDEISFEKYERAADPSVQLLSTELAWRIVNSTSSCGRNGGFWNFHLYLQGRSYGHLQRVSVLRPTNKTQKAALGSLTSGDSLRNARAKYSSAWEFG